MNKLALKRDKNWRERVKYLTDTILALKSEEFVAGVLEERKVQMTPTDFCFVVKWVGQENWQRALELYECLNLRHWFAPNARMVATILGVLGKANQEALAVEIFTRAESSVGDTVQVYNAMMGVYARSGRFNKVKELLDLMRERGCVPDLVSFNTLINARMKSGAMEPNLALQLLHEVRRSGIRPDIITYNTLISACSRESNLEEAVAVFSDMESHRCQPDLWTYNAMISLYGRCGRARKAEELFKELESKGFHPDAVTLNSLLYAFSREGNTEKVRDICEEMVKRGFGKDEMTYNTIIHMYGKQGRHDQALQLYRDMQSSGRNPDAVTYTVLIDSLGKAGKVVEAANVMSEMLDAGVKPTLHTYSALICAYAKAGKQVEAEETFNCMRRSGIKADRLAYSVMLDFFLRYNEMRKAMGLYHEMIREDSINGLLQALIVDRRLNELYVVIQELQDMGFKISKSSILLTLEAFAQAGNLFEVQKIYNGMKAAGYFPTMHLYRVMLRLLCKCKRVRDVEAMLCEMEEAGFKPDLQICNSILKLYLGIEDFKNMGMIYQKIQDAGLKPDEETYNTLIIMYCRDRRPEEGFSLMNKMRSLGLEPKLDTYRSLITAFSKQRMYEQAEELFEELRSNGYKLDRAFYHLMMKMYRTSGDHLKAENLLAMMKESGIEPTISTMHLLMVSYSKSGQPEEAENVLKNLSTSGVALDTLPYSSVIDAYLKKGDFKAGIEKLAEMKEEGIEPDHRIWTCFMRAASLSERANEAIILLNALQGVGFDLPIRLLKEKSESLVAEVDQCLERLEPLEDNAAFNLVNALLDLLWAFELRATASWVFQLAIKRSIYRHDIFRVADKDWGADFRKLSAGSALDASLQGNPESPKSVVLITGTAEYNMVSLDSTLKACLWEMGSPFLPCKTRHGVLVAKAHSLRMWLKDSPFCLDLELKNAPNLPESNSMQLIEGCFIRRGLVPAFKEITEKLEIVSPKKFSRLALLRDDHRNKTIQAYTEGRKEKLEKRKKIVDPKLLKKIRRNKKLKRRKHFREASIPNAIGKQRTFKPIGTERGT
uniref:Pentatricopeptide repeat-containing protein-mitochondrial domain-containing protein n=1 Tax=Cajanus cajan TaxID=3821 RepID=A0A151SD29_CAJCA|nr:hypothetical protein KK1_025413 [Cajanus cajan]